MSHQESHGGIIVEEGDEHPSHLNIEGQNAQHTNAAGEALSGESSHSETDEKKGGGKPIMEKYAYHSMSPSSPSLLQSFPFGICNGGRDTWS
jgi:hypothetical protein